MARRTSASPDTGRLYQVPLSDFVAERNALAKAAGPHGAEIRLIQKPTLPAWAVNQLYWKARPTYEALLQRADDLRATHHAALRGEPADLRGAGRAHEEALEGALKQTLALLAGSGHPVTEATKQAIATTLRGLPSQEPPGQLTRPIEPRGFEMLSGFGAPSRGQVRVAARTRSGTPPPATPGRKKGDADAERLASAREAAAAAARDLREAEGLARRGEFDSARAVREAEKAKGRVEEAEAAVREAQRVLEAAQQAARAAVTARDAAQDRAAKAAAGLTAARKRERAARDELGALT